MIDIHHQGTPVVEGTNEMSTFSFGISVAEHSLKGLSGIDGHPAAGRPGPDLHLGYVSPHGGGGLRRR